MRMCPTCGGRIKPKQRCGKLSCSPIKNMTTQYHKSNGEVMLSRWWRTASAKAAFRRVKLERAKRLRELRKRNLAKKAKLALVILLGLVSFNVSAALHETPEQFETGKPTKVTQLDDGVEMEWVGRTVSHSGIFVNGVCVSESFRFADRHVPFPKEIVKLLEPYGKAGMTMSDHLIKGPRVFWKILNAGEPFALLSLNNETGTLSVTQWKYAQPKQKVETTSAPAQDCVIAAQENATRLRATGAWAEVYGFMFTKDGTQHGHAMVVFQLHPGGTVFAMDNQNGSFDLEITSTEEDVIRAGLIAKLYKATDGKIEVTEGRILK
jgi:hypothetical protein